MFITYISYFLARRYFMKKMDIMYMLMGGCAVLAYQKYKKPMKKEIDKMTNKIKKTKNNMLENMD